MKKFTCTDKWDNQWHFALSPFHKLAWSFINDRCDHAGVIDVPDVLLAGYVGDPSFTMEAFAAVAGPDRIVRLKSGAWWLPKYIAFQHAGGVSAKKKPHQPAIRSILKNQLPVAIENDADGLYAVHNQWVKDSSLSRIPYPTNKDVLPKSYVTDSSKDRDKEKDKDQETDCARIFIEPTSDELDAALRFDPVEPLAKQTGIPRESMLAFIGTLNSGAERFTPESLLLAYANELTQREYRVYRASNQNTAPKVSPQAFPTDCARFVDLAIKRPDHNRLVPRTSAKQELQLLREPKGWQSWPCFDHYKDWHWSEIPDDVRRAELRKRSELLPS